MCLFNFRHPQMTLGSYLCWLNPSIKKMSKSTVCLVKYLILFGAWKKHCSMITKPNAGCWKKHVWLIIISFNTILFGFFEKEQSPYHGWWNHVKSTKICGWNIQFIPRCFMWNPLKSNFSMLKWLKSELSWAESTHFWILFHVTVDMEVSSNGGIPSHRGCFNTRSLWSMTTGWFGVSLWLKKPLHYYTFTCWRWGTPCSMFKLPYDLRNPSDNGQRDQDDAREDRETSHLRWSWWSQPGSTNRKSRFHPISPTKNEALTWFNHELNMLFNDEDPLIHENQNWWHERGNNSIMGNPNSSEGLIANHFMGIQGEYLINIISICIYQENGVSPKVWLF